MYQLIMRQQTVGNNRDK